MATLNFKKVFFKWQLQEHKSSMTLIKSPNRSLEIYWFCSVSSSSFLFFCFFIFFFLSKFCPHKFSVTIGRIGLKFGDMIDMIMKLCQKVTKGLNFKVMDSKAPLVHAKSAKILSGWVRSNHRTDCFEIWGVIAMDMKVCKWVSKGPCESMPQPLHFIRGLISQKAFRSPSINHIYSCSLW